MDIKQEKLSVRLNKNEKYLSQIETQNRNMPLPVLQQLAEELGLPCHKLLMERSSVSYEDYDKEDFVMELKEEVVEFLTKKVDSFKDGIKKKRKKD